jgi:outer membrane protein assembly complex protein YaeT
MNDDIRAAGETELELNLAGTMDAPQAAGFVELRNVQAGLRDPNIGLEDLDARLSLNGKVVTVERFTGALNGGSLDVGGSAEFAGTDVTNANINARMRDVFLNIPEGLRTIVDADLTVRSPGQPIVIGGTVTIREGAYREALDLQGSLLEMLRPDQTIDLGQVRSPVLSRVRYDVAINSAGPLLIDNNIAKLSAEANLQLVGTYYRPSILGRLTVEEGGEIRLNERRYAVERASIDFLNPNRIEPVLDIQATTQASGYDISLRVEGTLDRPKTTLTSPDLAEQDILPLLLTGRRADELQGHELDFAKSQALSLLAGQAGERISQGAQQALGLSTVRIEPSLISAESDPGARLTVGQDITRDLRLIYSMNLTNSNDQIWLAEYNITRRFTTRALIGNPERPQHLLEPEGSETTYRLEFRHDLRFGGSSPRELARRDQPVREIGTVAFKGGSVLSDEQLRKRLDFKPGDKYDFFKIQGRREELEKDLAEQGRLESKVSVDRQQMNGTVNLAFSLNPGPQVRFFFEGSAVSDDVKDDVGRIWREGVFDLQRAEDAVQAIRRPLVAQGYLQADVKYRIEETGDLKNVYFTIQPGVAFHDVELVFQGTSGIAESELHERIKDAGLENAVHNNPSRVVDFVTRYYRRAGYLQAEVEAPKPELDPATGTGRVVIAIKEGLQFKIHELAFAGNRGMSEPELVRAAALSKGATYTATVAEDSLDRILRQYRALGYNDTVVTYQTELDSKSGEADINYTIEEGRKEIVREIVVEGNDRTSKGFVRRQLAIAEGDVLDLERIARSRKALYDTSVYTLVDVETQPLPYSDTDAETKPVRLVVRVREVKPYRFLYGGSFDTERGPGAIADLSHRNFLGKALVLGTRTRYDGDFKEVRGYFSNPSIRGIPLKSNAVAFLLRETRTDPNTEAVTFVDRTGFSLFQEKVLRNNYLLNYGYRYERVHTFDKEPDPLLPFDISIPIASLTGSLSRDTRDNILDATRGSFLSHALEYAPKALGSDVRFVRYFGQYFRYIPLIHAREGEARPRLLYAGALRIGLARGFDGQELISSERFFTGGGTTIRGFKQNAVGPLDFDGEARGGEALFVLNNELRFPLFKFFDGVSFVDVGNAYNSVRDFNPFEVRKSAGVGLRVRTGYLLLRLDYGLKLDRRQGESRGAFFFSIGQAY